MNVQDMELQQFTLYAINAEDVARLQRTISRLNDGTRMDYDERRSLASQLNSMLIVPLKEEKNNHGTL